jgi:hypothetical protein
MLKIKRQKNSCRIRNPHLKSPEKSSFPDPQHCLDGRKIAAGASRPRRLTQQFHVDVADPVGAGGAGAARPPRHLHVEVVEAVPVKFGDAANVALVDLLVGAATTHCHPCPYKENVSPSEQSCGTGFTESGSSISIVSGSNPDPGF